MELMIDKWKVMLQHERSERQSRENSDSKRIKRLSSQKKRNSVNTNSVADKSDKVFKEDLTNTENSKKKPSPAKSRPSKEVLTVLDYEKERPSYNLAPTPILKTPSQRPQAETSTASKVKQKTKTSSLDIIDKISYMVLEATKREAPEQDKLLMVRAIMVDLYMPTLQMIEDLEKQLRLARKGNNGLSVEQSIESANHAKMRTALESRVQELTSVNCLLEVRVQETESELIKTRESLRELQASKLEEIKECGGL